MSDLCNHSSVGVVAERDGKFLLFDRQKFPKCKAPCAGHVDLEDGLNGVPTGADSEEPAFRAAGVRELEEETGLRVHARDMKHALKYVAKTKCRRQSIDGDEGWHLWRVYRVQIDGWQQERGKADESANLAWFTPDEIRKLTNLEPVWGDMLRRMKVI
ncbi:MAG: hypothetical protein JWO67_3996 [Streptosporangiaceae bacterium]|nr:hypothetical protein [Streptosporangiaceae bacterium]